MFTFMRRVRHLRRYREIVGILARHGFGSALEYLQVHRRLALPKSALESESPPGKEEGELTPVEHFRLALEELGPTFIKLGQILSTRSDLLPPPFVTELRRLQDEVLPCAWHEIRAVLTEELGNEPEEIFAQIDPKPIGSASLAQVHAARLLDGQEVVVKVQRPGIRERIETDLEILHDLALLAARTPLGALYRPEELVAEFALILRQELDYRREARNTERFREMFRGEPSLYIPRGFQVTPRVLVMERLHGIKISDVAALEAAGYDRRRVALHAARLLVKEVLEHGFFHADPHPGNFAVLPGEVIGAMDFGMMGHLSERDRLNLIRLYVAIARLDVRALVEQLRRIGAVGRHLDRLALERDLERLIARYQGLTLQEIRFAELWEEFMGIAWRHHLRLPTELWLVGKTLAMAEGVGRELDPEFDFFAVSEPFVRRLLRQLWRPRLSAPDLLADLDSWGYLLHEVPRVGVNLLRQLDQGEMPLSLQVQAGKETLDRLDRLATRLSLSILVGAFIVGLALLLPASRGNLLATVLTGFGFLAALTFGVWLLISIWRSGR